MSNTKSRSLTGFSKVYKTNFKVDKRPGHTNKQDKNAIRGHEVYLVQ